MEPTNTVGVGLMDLGAFGRGRIVRSARPEGIGREADTVELTAPAVRRELIDRVRAQIEAGHYESEERLDAAAGALMRSLEGR